MVHKKILEICTALAALGILAVGPAAALAATHLHDAGGNVPANALIKAIGGGPEVGDISTFEGEGLKWECNENYLTGSVHRAEGPVELTITSAQLDSNLTASGTDCKTNLGPTRVTIPALENGTGDWCIVSGATTTFNVFARACTGVGPGTFTFKLDVTGLTECAYIREEAVAGTYKHPNGTTQLEVVNVSFVREGANVFCPGSAAIKKMTFGLYTDKDTSSTTEEKTTHWDDATSTANPIEIVE